MEKHKMNSYNENIKKKVNKKTDGRSLHHDIYKYE